MSWKIRYEDLFFKDISKSIASSMRSLRSLRSHSAVSHTGKHACSLLQKTGVMAMGDRVFFLP